MNSRLSHLKNQKNLQSQTGDNKEKLNELQT